MIKSEFKVFKVNLWQTENDKNDKIRKKKKLLLIICTMNIFLRKSLIAKNDKFSQP